MQTKIVIDPEFQLLIPPLTSAEREGLEADIVREGCRDALVLWGNILIDGHNRFEICERLGIAYRTKSLEFIDRDDALRWIIENQSHRRNLAPFARIELAFRLMPMLRARAKANQSAGGGNHKGGAVSLMSAKPIDIRSEIAQVASVSHDTVSKFTAIKAAASEATMEKLRLGEITINRAYQSVRVARTIASPPSLFGSVPLPETNFVQRGVRAVDEAFRNFLNNPAFLSELEPARLRSIAVALDEAVAAIAAERRFRNGSDIVQTVKD